MHFLTSKHDPMRTAGAALAAFLRRHAATFHAVPALDGTIVCTVFRNGLLDAKQPVKSHWHAENKSLLEASPLSESALSNRLRHPGGLMFQLPGLSATLPMPARAPLERSLEAIQRSGGIESKSTRNTIGRRLACGLQGGVARTFLEARAFCDVDDFLALYEGLVEDSPGFCTHVTDRCAALFLEIDEAISTAAREDRWLLMMRSEEDALIHSLLVPRPGSVIESDEAFGRLTRARDKIHRAVFSGTVSPMAVQGLWADVSAPIVHRMSGEFANLLACHTVARNDALRAPFVIESGFRHSPPERSESWVSLSATRRLRGYSLVFRHVAFRSSRLRRHWKEAVAARNLSTGVAARAHSEWLISWVPRLEQTECLRFHPFVFARGASSEIALSRPGLNGITRAQAEKRLETPLDDDLLTLREVLAARPAHLRPFLVSREGRPIGFAELGMARSWIELVAAYPGALGTFQVWREGTFDLSSLEESHAFLLSAAEPKPGLAWNIRVALWGSTLTTPRVRFPWSDTISELSPLEGSLSDRVVARAQGAHHLRVVVSFAPVSSAAPGAGAREPWAREFGVLEPTFRFFLDGKTFSEEEWLASRKGKGHYVLPGGERLSADVYERCLAIYLLRRKALARFETITLRNVWQASRPVALATQKNQDPREFFSFLQIAIEGVEGLFAAASPSLRSASDSLLARVRSPLRSYQQAGVDWMLQRFRVGLGVCLADEMGLGKTCQAIVALAQLLLENPGGQVLVVCPKSLVANWRREFEQFAPHLRVVALEGEPLPGDGCDVIVTTYPRLRLRASEFQAKEWLCVVLDEAHQIKNVDSGQSQAARGLLARHRMALTGTPIENHARELWSLVDWMNPGWLGSESAFESYTRAARAHDDKALMLTPVREVLAPVLLRRLKTQPDVGLSLPPKIRSSLEVSLSEEQLVLYEAILMATLARDETRDGESHFVRSSRYLKALLHLKQVCNHPGQFLSHGEEGEDDVPPAALVGLSSTLRRKLQGFGREHAQGNETSLRVDRSGKLSAFLELMQTLSEQPRGILVFSQFRSTMRLIQGALAEQGPAEWAEIPLLTGDLSAARRMEIVDAFQHEASRERSPPPVLIASLKAGGVGLNLTGASHVIHFDRWWNPAVEEQASDRAHRLGQRNTVQVTTFVAPGTVEEGIEALFSEKQDLAEDLIGGSGKSAWLASALREEGDFLKLVDPRGMFARRLGLVRATKCDPLNDQNPKEA